MEAGEIRHLQARLRSAFPKFTAMIKFQSMEMRMPDAGKLFVGTSGYSYKEWKGSFYPEKLPDREMLPFYAKQFSTVEINHSFYRMPTETALLNWANAVPEGFRFALKANQKITHMQRLRECESTL